MLVESSDSDGVEILSAPAMAYLAEVCGGTGARGDHGYTPHVHACVRSRLRVMAL